MPPRDVQAFARDYPDMDAPTGSGFWHWVGIQYPGQFFFFCRRGRVIRLRIFLPARGHSKQLTDIRMPGYIGAAPNDKRAAHRYLITVHALKNKLELDNNVTAACA